MGSVIGVLRRERRRLHDASRDAFDTRAQMLDATSGLSIISRQGIIVPAFYARLRLSDGELVRRN